MRRKLKIALGAILSLAMLGWIGVERLTSRTLDAEYIGLSPTRTAQEQKTVLVWTRDCTSGVLIFVETMTRADIDGFAEQALTSLASIRRHHISAATCGDHDRGAAAAGSAGYSNDAN